MRYSITNNVMNRLTLGKTMQSNQLTAISILQTTIMKSSATGAHLCLNVVYCFSAAPANIHSR